MWRTIKKVVQHTSICVLVLIFFLAGFPGPALVDYVAEHVAERNIVDALYLAQQDSNVLDRGFVELMRPHVERAHAATFSVQTGYYIGNATDNRAITGLGFSPDMVLIKDNTSAGSDGILWKTSAVAGETTYKLGEAEATLGTNAIQSLDSDGFTIGTNTDVNSSNIMYYWVAFGGSDCTSSGTFCVGTYTGNSGTQSPNTGFQPDLVMIKGASAVQGVWKSSSMGANNTNYFYAATQDTSGTMITSLNASSFTVGNASTVNTAQTYQFAAFKQVSGAMDVGTYTGNATDSRNITSSDDAGLTFQPDFVFIKSTHVTTPTTAVFSITENYGDRSFLPTDTASAQNHIQELRSAGGFEIGNSTSVNGNGNTLYYAAFSGAAVKTPGTGDFSLANGTYTGTGAGFSITGLGFAPDLVIIKHNDQVTDQYAVWRSRVMVGDITHYFGAALSTFTGGITALGSDGFTIGTNATVNTSGDTYYWVAFGNAMEPDLAGGSSNFLIGAYIGDGQDNTNVEHLPIEPDFVATKRVSTTAGNWRTANQSGDLSHYYAATAQAANFIQALRSDGFQKGTGAGVNSAGSTYHYFAFATSSRFSMNTYTGTGASNTISDAGFQPDLLWLKKTTGGTARAAVLRTSAQGGDAAQPFLNAPTFTGGVTSMQAGGFTVNSAVETNENTFVYQYVAWDGKAYQGQVYRFFANTDSTDVGAALAAADAPATLSSTGSAFRLRMLVRVDNASLLPQGENFKLQFVGKGTGTCANPSGGTPSSYTDVTGATVVAFKDNPTPTDGTTLTGNANDPTDGGRTIVNQSYEESNDFSSLAGSTIAKGQDGKWDFSLFDNGAPANTTYCLRVVESDGTEVKMVSSPEVTTAAGGNATPTVASVSIDSGASAVTLIEGTTKSVACAGTVTDTDGYTDIEAVEGIFFRTSVGTSTVDDNNNKYTRYGDSQCVPSGGSGNTETYTCTSSVWHYADATDAGSPNASDTWTCEMRANDGTATSTAGTDTVEMNSLVALSVDTSIDYGTMAPGSSNTTPTVTVTNTGNRDMDPQLSGVDMTSGLHTIAVGQQRYKTFTYSLSCSGEGTQLTTTPTTVDITLPQRTSESTPVTDSLFWCLDLPNGSAAGAYEGTNTFTATQGL